MAVDGAHLSNISPPQGSLCDEAGGNEMSPSSAVSWLTRAFLEIWQGSEHLFCLWKDIYAPSEVWPGHSSKMSDVSSSWIWSSSFTALYYTSEPCSLCTLPNGGHWSKSKLFLMDGLVPGPKKHLQNNQGFFTRQKRFSTRQARPLGKEGTRLRFKKQTKTKHTHVIRQFELPRTSPYPSLESWCSAYKMDWIECLP